ncbi:MAG: hypothetical protein AB8B63_18650 [Granulosicoccus sp.]
MYKRVRYVPRLDLANKPVLACFYPIRSERLGLIEMLMNQFEYRIRLLQRSKAG